MQGYATLFPKMSWTFSGCYHILKVRYIYMAMLHIKRGLYWHILGFVTSFLCSLIFSLFHLIRYGLSECHLNPHRTRMDGICIIWHANTLKFKFHEKSKLIWKITKHPAAANHRVLYGVKSELYLTLKLDRRVREWLICHHIEDMHSSA